MKLFVVIFIFLLCCLGAGFSWNPSINTDVSVSTNPSCPGYYDVTIGGVLYPCFGTDANNAVTEQPCPNGLQGVMLNGTLTCGVITEYLPVNGECQYGGYRFLSNTQNFTNCYTNSLSYTVTSAPGGVSPISSSTNTSTVLKSFANTPSFTFSTTSTTISGDVSITATDVTSGFASMLAGCSGNNCNYRQIRGADSSLINVQQDSTTVYVTSNLKAQNLPYPNVSAVLFPDCAGATVQSEINECLALRTIPSLSNFTNAAQILYTPSQPVLGQVNITAAVAFNTIFINSKPAFTRIWNVDAANGNDVLGDGSPFAPYKTITKVFSLIGTPLWGQSQLVLLALGTYVEASLQWPPNTFIDGSSSNRVINIIVNGSITLRPDWATAGPHVEGGMSVVVLTAGALNIDFTIMGPRPPTSVAKFFITNCEVNAPYVGSGGGVTDLFHFLLSDIISTVTLNCGNTHFERNVINGAVLVTDTLCSATHLEWHFIYNYMEAGSNTTIVQSTSSDISADFFVNGWDSGFLAAYASVFGALKFNAFTLPLYYYISSNVIITRNLALEGSAAINLNTTYWGASTQNALQMMDTLASRSKTATSSGLGSIPLIYATTVTNTYFNDFSSSTPVITLFQSAGVIYIGLNIDGDIYSPVVPFRGLSTLSLRVIFDAQFNNVLPSVTGFWYVDPVNGDDSWSGAPNSPLRTIGKAFDSIATFPFLQMQTVLLAPGYYAESNLLWPPNTFVKSLGSMEDTIVFIASGNVELRSDWSTYANDHVEAGLYDVQWRSDKFIIDYSAVEGGAGGYSNSRFSFVRVSLDAYFIINGRGDVDYVGLLLSSTQQPIVTNCLDLDIQSCSLNGDMTISDSPCSVPDIFIHMQDNVFAETTSFSATRTDCANFQMTTLFNTFSSVNTAKFNGAINLKTNGLPVNVGIDPAVVLTNVFNLMLLGAGGISVTFGSGYYTATMTSTPSFTSESLTDTSNQLVLGTGNTITITAPTPAASRIYTIPDVLGAAFFVMTAGAQTIAGVKTFSSGIPITATTNQLVLGTTNTYTITAPAPAASRTYTIPDVLGAASFVMTAGAQTIAGVKTFSSQIIETATTNQFILGTTNTVTLTSPAPAASRIYTIPDVSADASFIMSQGSQFVNGAKVFTIEVSITPVTNQLVLGTTNTVTINSVAPAASRTHTIPDPLTNSAFVMADGASTINGVKTFSTAIAIGSGGTGASALTANGMLSMNAAATAVTSTVMTNGQIMIGRTGSTPVAAVPTGTANQVTVTGGSGTLAISTPVTFLAPGNIQDTTGLYFSTTNAITAAGATQGTATAITKVFNIVTTTAASTGVVMLTPAKAGFFMIVVNRGANVLNVYPAVGGTIDALGINVATTVAVNGVARFGAATTTQWYTI